MFLKEIGQPVRILPGVGPVAAGDFAALQIHTVSDLLYHFPRGYEDRIGTEPFYPDILKPDAIRRINTVVTVVDHVFFGWGKNKTLKVRVADDTGEAFLVCFGRNFLAATLVPGAKVYLHGKFSFRYGELQSSAFEFEPYSEEPKLFRRILPIYPLSGNLTQALVRKAVQKGIEEFGRYIEDELPEELRIRYGLLPKHEALQEIHNPRDWLRMEQAVRTLKYEELFYLQITIGRRSNMRKTFSRNQRTLPDTLLKQFIRRLPFELTRDQTTVLQEIQEDLSSSRSMLRLLQGDVGCGKTLVAFMTALLCIESGTQVAFMAPTELLARQHAENASRLLSPLGVRIAYLTSSIDREGRTQLLKSLKKGEVDMCIGTHALFARDVRFNSLGFVIVDEQQRFGVLQRMAVMEKGSVPDLLMMTATPIPRTMALTLFGDIEVSTIKTMPKGRKRVHTHLAAQGNEGKVYERVRRELEKGHQAYFVYPLIQQSEKLDLKDTETMYQEISNAIFPAFTSGLIHSKIDEADKEQTMARFVDGTIQILVATSVVEVGVDVPNATCMIIEHADRFGLSALHQLRGRVGRGADQSYAFLIYSASLTDDAKERLKIMKENSDGFAIAEEDLKLRGPGDIIGTRQSGYFRLRIAEIISDFELLKTAKEDAFAILKKDPGLLLPEHCVIRSILLNVPPLFDNILEGG